MPIPVLSVPQMRAWEDATWADGIRAGDVIARVGECIAAWLRVRLSPGARVLLVAGAGHNGDDVRATLPHLGGFHPELVEVRDPAAALPELQSALHRSPDCIIDGLFGIGLNRPLAAPWQEIVEAINASRARIVAVDVPSGLDASTGTALGAAIKADVTLTLGAPKRGLLSTQATPHVGRLEVISDIGLKPLATVRYLDSTPELLWATDGDFHDFPPRRPVDGNKGTFGHVVVIGGSPGYHGAAVLAARGALRAMPGLVTVLTHPDIHIPVASQLQAAMVHAWAPSTAMPRNATAIVLGPGLAAPDARARMEAEVTTLWRTSPAAVVADASALDWIADTAPSTAVSTGHRVVTPHPGEAARMLKCSPAEVQADRPAALRALSQRLGDCWVVLKGHQSLVGTSHGPILVNSTGNAGLAQGGAGDLLAGLLGGLLAQPALGNDPGRAIGYGIWRHGAAADRIESGNRPWTIEDLAQSL